MPRYRRHNNPSLAVLIDREFTLASRLLGLRRSRPRRSRAARAPSLSPLPRPAAPLDRLSPELRAYCARFPTVPDWLDPDSIVLGVDPSTLPCMADAEDGEQPWHSQPFSFCGPPDTTHDS